MFYEIILLIDLLVFNGHYYVSIVHTYKQLYVDI